MKKSGSNKRTLNEDSVSTIIEYISITGIVIAAMIILMLTMNSVFMEGPRDLVSYHSFVDIGNGVSTRIVDVYVLAPYVKVEEGSIKTKFSIPEEVARSSYAVDIFPADPESPGSEAVVVSRSSGFLENGEFPSLDEVRRSGPLSSITPLSGIGSTLGASGSTTGMGMKVICYNSSGGGCPP